jgi:hypothetical protein
MPMTDGRIGRWREMIREAVAVLAAILIAFALDAWWDARVERTSMLRALDAVAAEIDENIAVADSILEWNGRILDAAHRLTNLQPGDVPGLSDDEVADLTMFSAFQLMNPRTGALTAFVEGGFLAAVDDVELRATVAELPSILDELSEEKATYLDLAPTSMVALARAQGPAAIAEWHVEGWTPQIMRSRLDAIVRDREALVAVGARKIPMLIYGVELAAMVGELTASRARIEEALRGAG